MSDRVHAAAPHPCSACPWRLENQGKPHPHGWYTKKNLAGLWSKLRRGEAMTCHPTDPNNPLPEGARPVSADATTLECAGALILQQREVMKFQQGGPLANYRALGGPRMTRQGLIAIVERALFGGICGPAMTKPDLNEVGVGYPPLGEWTSR